MQVIYIPLVPKTTYTVFFSNSNLENIIFFSSSLFCFLISCEYNVPLLLCQLVPQGQLVCLLLSYPVYCGFRRGVALLRSSYVDFFFTSFFFYKPFQVSFFFIFMQVVVKLFNLLMYVSYTWFEVFCFLQLYAQGNYVGFLFFVFYSQVMCCVRLLFQALIYLGTQVLVYLGICFQSDSQFVLIYLSANSIHCCLEF